jgi:hypothetical protein
LTAAALLAAPAVFEARPGRVGVPDVDAVTFSAFNLGASDRSEEAERSRFTLVDPTDFRAMLELSAVIGIRRAAKKVELSTRAVAIVR